jgi:glycosyltransferase involved in cell wall biosynthesis
MKIIIAVNTLGSFLSHRRGLYLRLRQEHDVRVILADSENPDAAAKVITASQILTLPLSRKGTNPLAELRTIVAYYQHYIRQRPDLVHHFTIKPVIYGTLAARLAKVPRIVNSITGLGYVFTSKTLKARALGMLVKNLYRFCFASPRVRVIFQNTDDRDFFIQEKILAAENCFLVEGSGVDVGKFAPAAVSNPVPTVFLAARLLIEKGLFEFVDALRLLRARGCPFDAIVAGDIDPGNPGSVSENQFQQWKDSGLAQFLGHQTDMVGLLKKIDIACLPSYREGLPMSLLEAMAAGKPIVTTDVPGCRSTVKFAGEQQRNGFLVPVKDPVALADALEKLLRDPALCKRMGDHSRELAVTQFSTDKITSEIAKIYQF